MTPKYISNTGIQYFVWVLQHTLAVYITLNTRAMSHVILWDKKCQLLGIEE